MAENPSTPASPSYGVSSRRAFLSNCAMFQHLGDAGLDRLARISRQLSFQRGQTVFRRGEPAKGLFLVMDGRVKVFRYSADGKEQVLDVFGPGELFAEVPMFDGGDYPADCEALQDSVLLCLYRDDLRAEAREDVDFILGIMAVLAKRLRGFVELIDDLSLKEVAPRFARFLLKEAEGKRVNLRIPKRILASLMGTSPETVSRTLGRLQEEGIVSVEGRVILIHSPERLQAMLDGL